jgi:hypothetical protein
MKLWIRPLAGAAGLLLATSCALVPGARQIGPPNPEGVRATLLRDEAAVRTLKGVARFGYEGPRGSGSATQVVVLALPDRARVETLSPIGTTLLVATLRGETLQVHSIMRHEYAVGQANQETLGRLINVPVPPALLVRLLAGLSPLPIRAEDPRLQIVVEGSAVRVESVDGEWWQRLWTGPDGTGIERGEAGRVSQTTLRFGFTDRRPSAGGEFPFAVWIEDATQGGRLELAYERLQLNEPVEEALFDLPPPQGGQTRIIDLGGRPSSGSKAPGPPEGGVK